MTNQAMERSEPQTNEIRFLADGAAVALNVNFVRTYFCPMATAAEAFAFMRFCEYHGLNPFLRDAYLIKYDQKDAAQMVVGYHVWVKRAQASGRYEGFKSGIIVDTGETLERREGMFYRKSEEVLGGWCMVHLKGQMPVSVEVTLSEYVQTRRDGTPNKFWGEKPATMIHKVALSTAFRLAFPSMTAGMYDESEMGLDSALPVDHVIVEGTSRPVEDSTAPAIVDFATGEIIDPPVDPEPETPSVEGHAELPPERTCPSCGGEKAPGVVVCRDCNDAGRTPEPATAEEPAAPADPWETFAQDVEAAGLTLQGVLPKGSETIDAFTKIGGTLELARKRLAEAQKAR